VTIDLEPDLAQIDVEVLQDRRADAAAFLDQAQENVLGPDILVIEPLGLLIGQGHHFPCPICKALKHVRSIRSKECPFSSSFCGFGTTPDSLLVTIVPMTKVLCQLSEFDEGRRRECVRVVEPLIEWPYFI